MRNTRLPGMYLRTRRVELPSGSRILDRYTHPDFADAWCIRLPENASADPQLLAQHLFDESPRWAALLMRLRDLLVAAFGLKTVAQLRRPRTTSSVARIGIFRIYEQRDDEIVLGEDDRHLDFRLSVTREASGTADPSVITATVVKCHNLLGRAYLHVVAPFHRAIVRATLRRAARVGWPRQTRNPLNLLATVCQQLTAANVSSGSPEGGWSPPAVAGRR